MCRTPPSARCISSAPASMPCDDAARSTCRYARRGRLPASHACRFQSPALVALGLVQHPSFVTGALVPADRRIEMLLRSSSTSPLPSLCSTSSRSRLTTTSWHASWPRRCSSTSRPSSRPCCGRMVRGMTQLARGARHAVCRSDGQGAEEAQGADGRVPRRWYGDWLDRPRLPSEPGQPGSHPCDAHQSPPCLCSWWRAWA